MRAPILALLLFLVACDDGSLPFGPDASVEEGPAGSGSNFFGDGIAVSPPDIQLEFIVVALSVIVMAGPVRARRRKLRRDAAL